MAIRYVLDLRERTLQTLQSFPAEFRLAVAPVVIRESRTDVRSVGTSFYICTLSSGHALFVTARHVISEIIEAPDSFEAFILLPRDICTTVGSSNLMALNITQIGTAMRYTDAALLLAEDPNTISTDLASSMSTPIIDHSMPVVGEVCLALGYSDCSMAELDTKNSDGPNYRGTFNLMASQGVIEQVHPKRRDSCTITFPSFRTDSFFEHGMSGGPIINQNGSIIGIVSTAFDLESGITGTAYGALIALIAELGIDVKSGQVTDEVWMHELIRTGAVRIHHAAGTVKIRRDEDGVGLTWQDTAKPH